jgi:hypothetical protein
MGCGASTGSMQEMSKIILSLKERFEDGETELTFETVTEIEDEILAVLKLPKSSTAIPYQTKELKINNKKDTEQKKLVIFCDCGGTSLLPTNPTNISILYDLLSKSLEKAEDNYVFKYSSGINPEKSKLASSDFTCVDLTIITVLNYIFDNYFEGDELILFGFSRGSFVLRVICGILRWYGIPRKQEDADNIFTQYKMSFKKSKGEKFPPQLDNDKFIIPVISFLGIFDTVTGCGKSYLSNSDYFFHSDDLNPVVQSVVHIQAGNPTALFRPVSYFTHTNDGFCQSLENIVLPTGEEEEEAVMISRVFFPQRYSYREFRLPGSHGNIGGGLQKTAESEKCISNISLRMMLMASPFSSLTEELLPLGDPTKYPTIPFAEIPSNAFHCLDEKDMGKENEIRRQIYKAIEESVPPIMNVKAEVIFAKQPESSDGNHKNDFSNMSLFP